MMSSRSGIVGRRLHNGDRYDGAAAKGPRGRKSKVSRGTVAVREEEPSPKRVGRLVPKRPREAGNDPTFIAWEEKYNPPRDAVFHRPNVRTHISGQFAEAVRKHFARHGVNQCPVEVYARGRYPLNKKAGRFYQVKVGGDMFIVPTSFFRDVPLLVRPKPAAESPTKWRKPKVLKKKK